jgi:hypothetical protein
VYRLEDRFGRVPKEEISHTTLPQAIEAAERYGADVHEVNDSGESILVWSYDFQTGDLM